MCGIVGIAAVNAAAPDWLLTTMRDTLRHRGPDDTGAWWSPDRRVSLSHRRLAVIDLSPGGHQPMSDTVGDLWITFNGEIYNYLEVRRELEARGHRFRTASDTEVILASYRAWGVDCLVHLNGMFAFGLYDVPARRLFLARDRAGEKPLFYWRQPGRLAFASELKALMADKDFPRQIDLEALDFYLAYGYVPGEMCIFRGVRKLAPAHAVTYDLDGDVLRTWRYWQLPEPRPAKVDPDELVDELEQLLLDSVRLRLVADVPVGIMLSGGIDSGLVTAMAARVSSRPVRTFNVAFSGHADYDESPRAMMVARHFGTDHSTLTVEPASADLLPALARQYDEPMADSSMVPTYLVSRLIRSHATVALGGDGGDELFGGYRHYPWIQRVALARQLLPGMVRRLIAAGASRMLPLGFTGRNLLIGCGGDVPEAIAHATLFFDSDTRRRLLVPTGFRGRRDPEAYKAGLCLDSGTPLEEATAVDFRTYLPDDIMVKVDRASMLTSLEVRAPWLDHRIIEMAFGRVPEALRVARGRGKVLPRLLAARVLPPQLGLPRKQGFSLPLDSWFRGDWGRYLQGILLEADASPFDPKTVRRVLESQQRGYRNTQRLFALAFFELWRREYGVTI
jgi:asparagine synthase (glutamine-hydrolysing)